MKRNYRNEGEIEERGLIEEARKKGGKRGKMCEWSERGEMEEKKGGKKDG